MSQNGFKSERKRLLIDDGVSDLKALGRGGRLKSSRELVIVGMAKPFFDNLKFDGLEITAKKKERPIFHFKAALLKMAGALAPR